MSNSFRVDHETKEESNLNKPVSPKGKSILNIHWKDWCWSWNSNNLTIWYKEPIPWKRPWYWERLQAGGEGATEDEMVACHYWVEGHEFEQALEVGDGQGSLVCYSPWGHKELDTMNWTDFTSICFHHYFFQTNFSPWVYFSSYSGGGNGLIAKSCPTLLWPHGLQPARLLHLWDIPVKSTGVGCHFLLQGIFLIQELNPHILQILYSWALGKPHTEYLLIKL